MRNRYFSSIIAAVFLYITCISDAGALIFVSRQPIRGDRSTEKPSLPQFEQHRTIHGTELSVKNVALVKVWFFDLYVIALYAPSGIESAQQIMGNTPKILSIQYLRNISRQEIIDAAQAQLQANPDISYNAVADKVNLIAKQYRNVTPGDRYELVYHPEIGTELYFNGTKQITITGDDFAHAYFSIWLGDFGMSKKLSDILLDSEG